MDKVKKIGPGAWARVRDEPIAIVVAVATKRRGSLADHDWIASASVVWTRGEQRAAVWAIKSTLEMTGVPAIIVPAWTPASWSAEMMFMPGQGGGSLADSATPSIVAACKRALAGAGLTVDSLRPPSAEGGR